MTPLQEAESQACQYGKTVAWCNAATMALDFADRCTDVIVARALRDLAYRFQQEARDLALGPIGRERR